MSNIRWKPMPDHPGFEINRLGWVRNERGYVVASGRGAQLMVGGARFGVTRKLLQEIAAGLFGETAPSLQAEASPAKLEGTPVCEAAELPAETVALPVHTAPDLAAELLHAPAQEQPKAVLNERRPSVPHATRDRVRDWLNPERVLPLRDPWADGTIETDSDWDWAGVR